MLQVFNVDINDRNLKVLEISNINSENEQLVDVSAIKLDDKYYKLSKKSSNIVMSYTNLKNSKIGKDVCSNFFEEWKTIVSKSDDGNLSLANILGINDSESSKYLIISDNTLVDNVIDDYYSLEELFNTFNKFDTKVMISTKKYGNIILCNKEVVMNDGKVFKLLLCYYTESNYVYSYMYNIEDKVILEVYDNSAVSRRSRFTCDMISDDNLNDIYVYSKVGIRVDNKEFSVRELTQIMRSLSGSKYTNIVDNYVEDALSKEYELVEGIVNKAKKIPEYVIYLNVKNPITSMTITSVTYSDIMNVIFNKLSNVIDSSEDQLDVIVRYTKLYTDIAYKVNYDIDNVKAYNYNVINFDN